MSFTEAIQDGFGKYVQFSGRSSRSAYWWWWLFSVLSLIAAELVSLAIGSVIVYIVVGLALVLPGIAVGVRRLHDTGRTGWWYLIVFLPIIGGLILLVFFVLASDGPNEYGGGPDDAVAAQPLA